MAYVNVAEWKPEQVTEWLKGRIQLLRNVTSCFPLFKETYYFVERKLYFQLTRAQA